MAVELGEWLDGGPRCSGEGLQLGGVGMQCLIGCENFDGLDVRGIQSAPVVQQEQRVVHVLGVEASPDQARPGRRLLLQRSEIDLDHGLVAAGLRPTVATKQLFGCFQSCVRRTHADLLPVRLVGSPTLTVFRRDPTLPIALKVSLFFHRLRSRSGRELRFPLAVESARRDAASRGKPPAPRDAADHPMSPSTRTSRLGWAL